MQRWKGLVALIVTSAAAACGSPGTNDGSTLDTLLPPPTGEIQDAPPPGASTSTSAASAGPVSSMATTTIPGAWSTGRPIGGSGTGPTGATSATQAGSATETTGTEQTSTTTEASPTTAASSTTQASSTTAPTPPTTPTTAAQQAQTITFAPLVAPWAYGEARSIMASASSALPVAFDAEGACVVDNALLGVVRADDVGECSITVAQKGDGRWKAATPITRSITISRATPVISGFDDTSVEHPRVEFSIALTAAASTGAPVDYYLLPNAASTDLCTVTDAVLAVQVTSGSLPRTCTVAAFVEESRLYETAISTARFTISPTVVKLTGHTVSELTDSSVTLSVSVNRAWRIDVVATSPIGDPPSPCGTLPDVLEGAATYTFPIALLAPITDANPCDIIVTVHTVDAAHTSDELVIKLP